MKRILKSLLCLMLVLSMSVPSYAANNSVTASSDTSGGVGKADGWDYFGGIALRFSLIKLGADGENILVDKAKSQLNDYTEIWEKYVGVSSNKSIWVLLEGGSVTGGRTWVGQEFKYTDVNNKKYTNNKFSPVSDLYSDKVYSIVKKSSTALAKAYNKLKNEKYFDSDGTIYSNIFNNSTILERDYRTFCNAFKCHLGKMLYPKEFENVSYLDDSTLDNYVVVVEANAIGYHKTNNVVDDVEVVSIAQIMLGKIEKLNFSATGLYNIANNIKGKNITWNLQGTRQTTLPYSGGEAKDSDKTYTYVKAKNGATLTIADIPLITSFAYIGTYGASDSGTTTNISLLYEGTVGTRQSDEFSAAISTFTSDGSSIKDSTFKVFNLNEPLGSGAVYVRKRASKSYPNETRLHFLGRLLRFQSAWKLGTKSTTEEEEANDDIDETEVSTDTEDTEEKEVTVADELLEEDSDNSSDSNSSGVAYEEEEAESEGLSQMEEYEVVSYTVNKTGIEVNNRTRTGAMGAMTFYVKNSFFVTEMTSTIRNALMEDALLTKVFPQSVKWKRSKAGVGYTYDFAAKGTITYSKDNASLMVHTKTILNSILGVDKNGVGSNVISDYFYADGENSKKAVKTFSAGYGTKSYTNANDGGATNFKLTSYGQKTAYDESSGKTDGTSIADKIADDFNEMFKQVLLRSGSSQYISGANAKTYYWNGKKRVQLTTELEKTKDLTDVYVDTEYTDVEGEKHDQKYTYTCEVFYRINTVSSNKQTITLSGTIDEAGDLTDVEVENASEVEKICTYTTDKAQDTTPDSGTKAYIIVPNYLYGEKTYSEFTENISGYIESEGFSKETLSNAIKEAMNNHSASKVNVTVDDDGIIRNENNIEVGKIAFGDDLTVGSKIKFGAITYNKEANASYNKNATPEISSANKTTGVDDSISGYTVIELRIDVDVKKITGSGIILPAYFLNRYYTNVGQTGESAVPVIGNFNQYRPNTNSTEVMTYNTKEDKYKCKEKDNHSRLIHEDYLPYEEWDTIYTIKATGTVANMDNKSGLYYLKTPSGVSKLTTINTSITIDPTSEASNVFDYTFNLIRSASEDKRTLSSLMYSSVKASSMVNTSESINTNLGLRENKNLIKNASGVGDTNEVLKLDYASTPKTVKSVSKTNSSEVTVDWNNTESFTITAKNAFTGSTKLYNNKKIVTPSYIKTHGNSTDNEGNVIQHGGDVSDKHTCTIVDVDNPSVLYAFKLFTNGTGSGTSVQTMTYTFTTTVYKYKAYSISVGRVSGITGTATMVATGLTKNLSNGKEQMKNQSGTSTDAAQYLSSTAEGYVKSADAYRNVAVNETGVVINFYPEVRMLANALQSSTKSGNTAWSDNEFNSYNVLFTMGEVKRTVNQSSMYIVSLDTSTTKNPVSGTVYSDSMQGSTSVNSTKYPIIPAGSDVNITVNAENITVDLYGYALDVINKDIDSTMDYKDGTAKYSDIIKSNEDLDTAWSNSDTYKKAQTSFVEWARGVLKKENFGADLLLSVDAQKKAFTNFGATIGKIVDNNSSTDALDSSFADGVFPIAVKNGKILKDNAEYKALIKQIAKDYYNDETKTTEAEKVFEQSGVYTALLNAIESSTSSKNKSGKADAGVSTLHGGTDATKTYFDDNNNWYDEVVRTFVIRRYKYEGAKFKDIIATDKIDYGTGVNSNSSNSQNASKNNQNVAKWYLTLYFNEKACKNGVVGKTLLGDTASYYNPSKSSSLGNALSTNTVLLSNNYIDGADFVLPASTTSDFNR